MALKCSYNGTQQVVQGPIYLCGWLSLEKPALQWLVLCIAHGFLLKSLAQCRCPPKYCYVNTWPYHTYPQWSTLRDT